MRIVKCRDGPTTEVGGRCAMTWSIAGLWSVPRQCPHCRLNARHQLPLSTALATTYSHATFGENVVSLVTKFEPCRLIFSWLDKSLCKKLIKHGPFVRF